MARRVAIAAIALAVALGGVSALRAMAGSRVERFASEFHDIAIACSDYYAAGDCVRCHGINPHRFEAGVPLALPPEEPNCMRCHEQSLWPDVLNGFSPMDQR